MRRACVVSLLGVLLCSGVAGAAQGRHARHRQLAWKHAFQSGERYARTRRGRVSFALVDDQGRLRQFGGGRTYFSASVVKAMLMVSYLNRHGVRSHHLSSAARRLLHPMITRSDNGAASRVFGIVGQRGLRHLAHRVGMRHFATSPAWGDTRIAASDQARFFYRIDKLVPRRHRAYARHLLASVIGPQRWGIARTLPRGAHAFFKGGWRPIGSGWIIHQAALVERRDRRVALAVLTDHDRSDGYGHETIRGIAARVLRPLAEP